MIEELKKAVNRGEPVARNPWVRNLNGGDQREHHGPIKETLWPWSSSETARSNALLIGERKAT